MGDIKNAITEAKTGFQLVLPAPDDFFIDSAETSKNGSDETKQSVSHDPIQPCGSPSCLTVNKDNENLALDTTCNSGTSGNDELTTIDVGCKSQENLCVEKVEKDRTTCSDTSNNENKCIELDNSSKGNIPGTSLDKGESSSSCSMTKDTNNEMANNRSDSCENFNQNGELNSGSDADDSDEYEDEDESDDEDVLHKHGLGNVKYNLSIDVTPGVVSLKETEDNKDILQTLKDHYRLIVSKYKPTVNKWIQVLL